MYTCVYTNTHCILPNENHIKSMFTTKQVVPHRNACFQTSCLVAPLEAHNLFWLCNVVVQVWFKLGCVHNLCAQSHRLTAYLGDYAQEASAHNQRAQPAHNQRAQPGAQPAYTTYSAQPVLVGRPNFFLLVKYYIYIYNIYIHTYIYIYI